MTRLAIIQREEKREKMVKKYEAKRKALLHIANSTKSSDSDKFGARLKLQTIPRNAMPNRLRNRCAITGRPRGVFRKFGLGRNKLRELANEGMIPGLIKASW